MFRSWRLGTAFGIPLYLHPTLLLLPALVLYGETGNGWFNALMMTVLVGVVFGCVLLHELGHALAARGFGIPTRNITLYPIGGVARLERMSERPIEEMLIAVAGPAVNLVIACLLLPVVVFAYHLLANLDALTFHLDDGLGLLAAKFTVLLMAFNVALMLFNLLPAFPSDGGRVFRLLALVFNRVRATEIAATVGVGMAVLIGLLVFVTGNPIALLVALFLIYAGRQEVLYVRRQAEQTRWAVPEATTEGYDLPPAPDFSGFHWDRHYQVWVLWRNGRPIEVYQGGAE